MSKPVKEMMIADYQKRFAGIDSALLIDIRGMDANDNNAFRIDLRKKDIRVTIVKNTLARKAFSGTALQAITGALDGPVALVYGAESVVEVARELVEWARKADDLDLKGALLDGEYFEGKAGVVRLSQYPTRPESQARIVQLVLAPASSLAGAVLGPGARILAVVKEIQERLEKGETIGKA